MKEIQTESNIRKVAFTSLSGTSIEWYDFLNNYSPQGISGQNYKDL
tara:strand:+ start:528 stop:665 length:138 start_codon:yes stop_codon:yes gene_type:complete